MLHVPAWETSVRSSLSTNTMVVQLLVGVAAVTGFVIQNSSMRGRKQEEEEAA